MDESDEPGCMQPLITFLRSDWKKSKKQKERKKEKRKTETFIGER